MTKNIIITGTSRGIGLELSLQLAAQGHQILALSRNISSEFQKYPNINFLSFDLAQPNDLQKVREYITNNWQNVDCVIHNAGYLVNKPFETLTQKDFVDSYQINVFGVASLTQIVLPLMKKGSHVVTISSMGGVQGTAKFAGLAAYSSSKGAVITLSELLAEEYKEQGISFNVLALGAVQTEMLQEAFPGYQAPISAKDMAKFISSFALTGHEFFNGKIIPVSSSNP